MNGETGDYRKILRTMRILAPLTLSLYSSWYLREFAVSAKLGAGEDMDTFLVAYSTPLFAGNIFTSVLPVVLVPVYLRMKAQSDKAARSLRNRTYTWLLVILLSVSAVQAFSAPWLIGWIGAGLTSNQIGQAIPLMWVLTPVTFFAGLFGLSSSYLLAEKRFREATLLPAISSVIPAVFVWFGTQRMGIWSLAWGMTLGWGVQAAIALRLLRRTGNSFALEWGLDPREVLRGLYLAGPVLVGVIGTGLIPIIDRAAAASMASGTIAALGYADRLFQLTIGFISALLTVPFSFFSEQVAFGKVTALRKDFLKVAKYLFVLSLPSAALLIFFSTEVVQLLFGRGAFDEAAVRLTGQLLSVYATSLSIAIIGNLAVRVVTAFQDGWTIAALGSLNPVIKYMLNVWLVSMFAASGLAWSFAGMTLITTIVLLARVRSWMTKASTNAALFLQVNAHCKNPCDVGASTI